VVEEEPEQRPGGGFLFEEPLRSRIRMALSSHQQTIRLISPQPPCRSPDGLISSDGKEGNGRKLAPSRVINDERETWSLDLNCPTESCGVGAVPRTEDGRHPGSPITNSGLSGERCL